MHIDKNILEKAVKAMTPGTPESNGAFVEAIVGNDYTQTIIKRGIETFTMNNRASIGTVLQMGIEIGMLYAQIAEKEKTHAEQV